ncbi:transporter [Desulfococcus sp.]|uniref:transporter n=1 Tax=Desulfococcus sp. TaxID=2025834 RepID=UPI0035942E8F
MKKQIHRSLFSVLIHKFLLLFCMFTFALSSTAWAAPGILQIATRDGFFSNQFPDTLITLTHTYFYWADEYADADGNESDIADTDVALGIVRLIKPWHFGDSNQFQYILEGIFSMENLSIEGADYASSFNESGIWNPMLYTSLGWNNEKKTTHLQAALIAVAPWGDDDLKINPGDNSYQVMPILAFQQQFGNFWIDGSMGYYMYFDDLSSTNTSGRDYFEINIVPSYHLGNWSFYLQGDYRALQESKVDGVELNDDGYNVSLCGGVGWFFRPDMQLNLKYEQDIDGESDLQGQGFNLRWMWIF